MTDASEPVMLDFFPNPYIAETIANILKEEGLAAYVEGANLQDPVASSQRAMGNMSVRVYVPAAQLAEAQRVLAAARAAGRVIADRERDSGENAGDPAS